MATSIYYTRHDGGLTLYKHGKQSTVSSAHQNFNKILTALAAKQWEVVESLMSLEKTINHTGQSTKNPDCKVFVKNGKVYFSDTRNRKEVQLHGTLVDRILCDLGKPGAEKYADALIAMLDNIQKNKQKDITEELYEWLASGKTPITYDGCILAYKKVQKNFLDIYSSTLDNSPGKIVRMKQAEVNPDRDVECSSGLHFASLGYLSQYASGHTVVIVKVNPRHIFAIPRDYQCQKGRASEYLVVGEYLGNDNQSVEAFSDAFIDDDNFMTAAPSVKFTKSGLRPSLEALAESYGLVKDGRVKIAKTNAGDYIPLYWDADKTSPLVKATSKQDLDYVIMSLETKSVRNAVKAALNLIKEK